MFRFYFIYFCYLVSYTCDPARAIEKRSIRVLHRQEGHIVAVLQNSWRGKKKKRNIICCNVKTNKIIFWYFLGTLLQYPPFYSPSLSHTPSNYPVEYYNTHVCVYIYIYAKVAKRRGRASRNDFWNFESFLSCTTPNCLNSHGHRTARAWCSLVHHSHTRWYLYM